MNVQRVYQMSRLAMFEKEHREELDGARGYFRSDYIGRQMIGTWLRTTAAYLLILAGWGLYHFELLTLRIMEVDIRLLLAGIAAGYAALLFVMLLLTYLIWSYRYAVAEDDLEFYHDCLKELEKQYEKEDESNRVRQSIRRG